MKNCCNETAAMPSYFIYKRRDTSRECVRSFNFHGTSPPAHCVVSTLLLNAFAFHVGSLTLKKSWPRITTWLDAQKLPIITLILQVCSNSRIFVFMLPPHSEFISN